MGGWDSTKTGFFATGGLFQVNDGKEFTKGAKTYKLIWIYVFETRVKGSIIRVRKAPVQDNVTVDGRWEELVENVNVWPKLDDSKLL